MSQELAKQDDAPGKELAVATETASPGQVIAQVMSLAERSDIDPGNLKVLADLGIQLEDREAERRYREAKSMAMAMMPSIGKKGEILNKNKRVQSRFSHYEELHRVINPILEANNLSLDFIQGDLTQQSGGFVIPVAARLTYSDGEVQFVEHGGFLPFPIDNMGGKSPVQGVASSLSMGKRHTMKSFLNIREHDGNDGEAGGAPEPEITDAEQVLISDAMQAANDGSSAYAAYWRELSRADKAFLVTKGTEAGSYHDQNKAVAQKLESD